ncbi:hypothetical protein PFTANZ_02005, partial [Plasmodium falciparum Tanzania (2000708)]
VNNQNKKYNIDYIQNSTQMIMMKSRRLTEIQMSKCPHYYNDPELKKIIDKLNEERIKKYREVNNSFEELRELFGKEGTKFLYKSGMKKSSKKENELLKKYEDTIRDEHNVISKSGIYTNKDKKSNNKSRKYENEKISGNEMASSYKVHDNYLDNLRKGCFVGVGICTFCSLLVSNIGIGYAVTAAKGIITTAYSADILAELAKILANVYFFFASSIHNAPISSATLFYGDAFGAATTASTAFLPYGIVALVLIVASIAIIFLFIWLRKRRKHSWKYECKKHLCT